MDKNARVLETIRLLADDIHDAAEQASAMYEQDRPYRCEDLRPNARGMQSARIIAKVFIRAARLRDAKRLRAFYDALLDALRARRQRKVAFSGLAFLKAGSVAALGVASDDFDQRQKRMTLIILFLAMEILALGLIAELGEQDAGDDGGSTATYLVQILPELRPPCPIAQYEGDVDQEDEYDQEGQR